MNNIRAIRTDADLAWAIGEVSQYFENPPDLGSEGAERFDVLSNLIEAFEDKHYPIVALDPIEMIKGHMAMFDRSQSDLATLLGSRSRASEVLNKKRALTVEMVHKLNKEWGIPADILVAPYHLTDKTNQKQNNLGSA
jgi:HTH-type transcriptional regulator / antitoxin HigA